MADGWKIRMSAELAEGIRRHGAETYPHECCGALLGRDGSGKGGEAQGREIVELQRLTNQREDSPRNRFAVAPHEVIAADRAAQARGLEVVGWYHSHPDHPARPSEYDREHAWPWYSYVIVKVEKGKAREMTSWRLKEDRGEYEEEQIEIASIGLAK
ncbi:MAG TPA: M67 family metallopeptidase [Candidatus Sulfotelmatobacter sp.]|nr:M67 family metallopeptidase [Candidatus Sulfotelmatobacter sp.]